MQIEDKEYWKNFGYRTAGPVVLSFCQWLVSQVYSDDSVSDIVFVARDGYLPYMVFNEIADSFFEKNTHYIYAPRAIALSMNEIEKTEYKSYIESFNFGKGRVVVVDSTTERFSAQLLIDNYIKNSTIGMYWSVFDNAIKKAKSDGICYKTFQNASDENLPCWPLMEFILSAPERPIKTILNQFPVYFNGNTFEETRLSVFPLISEGVKHYVQDCKHKNLTYSNASKVLINFYMNPTDDDIIHFSQITVSSLPDHSDDYIPTFFQSENSNKSLLQKKYFFLIQHLRKSKLNSLRLSIKQRRQEKKINEHLFSGKRKALLDELSKADIISFDIFDTLIFRKVDNPYDVFERLEKNNDLPDFKNTRKGAESIAARSFPELNGQVSIYEIYNVLHHFYGDKIDGLIK